jgi:radical SAM protein with 4Fe4S-binding SPASM domain
MKPNPGPPIDKIAFEKMRRIVPSLLAAQRTQGGDWHAQPLPEELSFKLTNRCDLRCTHCYQWHEGGYHHQLPHVEKHGDLDLSIIARTLEATRSLKANVYLWGGEPLVYHDWDGLIDLLANDARWTALCTNGTLIEKRIESLNRISRQLEVSVSLDGFESEHDLLRGCGSFGKSMGGLRLLIDEKRAGRYAGEITVNCVVSDGMVTRLFEFAKFLEQEGVDTAYISFPWYVSAETCSKMDRYLTEHFSWAIGHGNHSWHSYSFRIDPKLIDALNSEVARIDAANWRLKLRYNPQLDPGDMAPFIAGSDTPAQGKTRCNAIKTRLDVFPNGDVVSCKFFPEFRVGNLKQQNLNEVWHSGRFDQVRETVATCGLMPVCAKCNLLYTRGT